MTSRYKQPQTGPIEALSNIHSALTPATSTGGLLRTITGPTWTAVNTGALSTSVRNTGIVAVNSSNGYWQRANPFQSGPLTVVFSHTPSTIVGTVGLWSLADTYQSGGPYLLIQRQGANLRVFTGASYGLTISNAFAVGVQASIAISILQLSTTYSQTNYLALNGVLYYISTYITGAVSKVNEYLGSGYSGQGAGDYGEYFALQKRCTAEEVVAFTKNPYQLLKPAPRYLFPATVFSGAYSLTAQGGTYAVSGSTANFLRSKLLISAGGSYALSGQQAQLVRNKRLSVSGATYISAGNSVTLLRSRKLTVLGGTYTLTGRQVSISYTPASGAYSLTAQGGSYSLISADVILTRSKRLTATGGTYTTAYSSSSLTIYTPGSSTLFRYINVLTGEVMILKPF